MTHVDKYIRKLLFEFDCVIIPDFGGLLTHRVGVRYDEAAQIFKPSGKRLAFNEILKIDDGLLAYYLSVGENISREHATEATRQFVESLRSDLTSHRAAKIDKVGSFSTNYEGKLIFEPDYSQNYDQEWYGLEAISAERHEISPNWLGQENVVLDTEVFVASEHAIVPLSGKRNLRWGWAAAAVFVIAASVTSYFYQPTDHSLLSSLDPVSLVKNFYSVPTAKEAIVHTENEVFSPVNVVYFQESKPEFVPVKEDSKAEDIEEVVVEVTRPAPVVKLKEDYYLIAGAFGGQKNARKLKAQLLRQGLKDVTILDNYSENYILVSSGSYKTHAEALQHKSKVDKLAQAESWVYHRN